MTEIVRAAIYPPIGICRVGNSPDEFYLGPEVPDPAPLPPGAYRDAEGRLKREAARFRVYGLDKDGAVVRELTANDKNTKLAWRVTLENQKASWYEFQLAQDIPEAADAPPQWLRNITVQDRKKLRIAPGERKISGTDKSGGKYTFGDGKFMGTKVYLGELRTDDAGRLIVLGGRGVSASYEGKPATTFANNDGWHDDTADGPVTATVKLGGKELPVEPAWVVVAPPNYGPQQKSVRTMWDLMRSVAVAAKTLPRPDRPSFRHDLQPLFERLSTLQWVNQGFAAAFGFRGPFDLSTPGWLERLADPSPAFQELRRTISNNFRRFEVDSWSPVPWPWVYGDAMSVPAAHTPRQNAKLSDLQLWFLDRWVAGDFEPDYDPNHVPPRTLDEIPVADQPDALTQAAMDFCLADAFHPGCEMTWPMRQAGMYESAFRVKHRPADEPEGSYGSQLGTAWQTAYGPINGGQSPGSITRWMAVPWQTDTASCRSGYDATYDPYVPTFWPARVPNEVMSRAEYETVMDGNLPKAERLEAFARRANWLEPLGLHMPYQHQINHMIHHFDQMGVVEVQPGLPDDPDFPAEMQVSDQPESQVKRLSKLAEDLPAERADLSAIEKVHRFPSGLTRSRDE